MITTILLLSSFTWLFVMSKKWPHSFLFAFITMITFMVWFSVSCYYAFALASRTTFMEQLRNCDIHMKGHETICKHNTIDKMNELLYQKKALDYLLHWNILDIK